MLVILVVQTNEMPAIEGNQRPAFIDGEGQDGFVRKAQACLSYVLHCQHIVA
jgi:hypothetical protein